MRYHQLACSVLSGYVLVVLLLSFCLSIQADPGLDYQRRGNRNEGVKHQPISSYDIDLLSATAYHEVASQMPDQIKLRFFLDGASPQVAITVREIDNKDFYWMDHVEVPWRSGFNDFKWSTAPVLLPLHASDGLNLSDLGVVANLRSSLPMGEITVAPVVFYHDAFPSAITEYDFDFKTDQDARMEAAIYSVAKPHQVYSQPFPRVASDTPFSIRWSCANQPDGDYRLVIKGYTLSGNDPIEMTVNFHHRRILQ